MEEEKVSDTTKHEIRTVLLDTLSKLIDMDTSKVNDSDRLREDLGLDSLQSMELLSRISDHYDLDIDVEDVMDVQTIADVVEELAGHMS
jgi:acyl carrier protein